MILTDISPKKLVRNWMGGFSRASLFGKVSLAATLLASALPADAKIIYVNVGVAEAASGDGKSWSTAIKYLQDGLANAVPGDEIYLAKGTYYPDDGILNGYGDRELSFELNGVKLYGGFAGNETTLSQRDPVANLTALSGEIWEVTPVTQGYERYWSLHVVVLNGNATMDGLTLEKGRANGETAPYNRGGGCLVTDGFTLTLNNCQINNHFAAEAGGAIWGKVIATDCTFSDNLVNNQHLYVNSVAPRPRNWLFDPDGSGGAIAGDVTAVNCDFLRNTINTKSLDLDIHASATGGAIAGNLVSLTNCTFESNLANSISNPGATSDATSRGGAVSVKGKLTAVNCVFTDNNAVSSSSSNVSPDPKAIAHYTNYPTSIGGAIAGQIDALNCVFERNGTNASATRGDEAGVISCGSGIYTEGSSNVSNCVFLENSVKSVDATLRRGAHSSYTRGAIHVAEGSVLPISQCTFMNNLSAADATCISVHGSVNLISNILWYDDVVVPDTAKDTLIHVAGRARISNRLYPTPSTETISIVRGGFGSVTTAGGANIDFGEPPERTFINIDPAFADPSSPVGADGIWRTQDDGLRLTDLSPAVGLGKALFLPRDSSDLDDDGDTAEQIPVDIAHFVRIQGGGLDLGAYEFGDIPHRPEIEVEQPLVNSLVDGSALIDFGVLPGVPVTKVFTIKNTGLANLNNLSISVTGTSASSFSVVQPPATVLPGAQATFAVTLKVQTGGLKTASLHIASNDLDENPFDIDLTGTVYVPDITVEQPVGTPLVDDLATVNYGNVPVYSSASKEFTIGNSGQAPLVITSILSSGTNAADFVVVGPVASSVAPGATTTFIVKFTARAAGARVGSLVIKSNDPDGESVFEIGLKGNGTASPEIAVYQPYTTSLLDGQALPFGSVKRGLLYTKTFTIKNMGSLPLTGIAVSLKGSSMFSYVSPTVKSLNPGAKTTFTVTFKPSKIGSFKTALAISSNDADESPFDLGLTGTGISATTTFTSSQTFAMLSATSPELAPAVQSPGVVTISTSSDGKKFLVLTVEKPSNWALSNHRVEVSSNLLDWYSGSAYTTLLLDSQTTLKVRDNKPLVDGGKRYIRLK